MMKIFFRTIILILIISCVNLQAFATTGGEIEVGQQMYVVGGSKTNVRKGASTEHDIVATLYGNTAVMQLSTSGPWSYIKYGDDQYGYISTSHLAEKPENVTGTIMYVSPFQITLYAEPDTSCGETLVLGHGTAVEDRGSYYETSYHVIGYGESTWYLYDAGSKLSASNTDTEQQMYVVGGSMTNVRAGASTSYDTVAVLYGNMGVTRIYSSGSWSYIRYGDGQYGYIATSRLAEKPENTTGTTMYVSSSQITLYAEPNTSCGETLVLSHGTEVEDRGSYYETSYHVIGYGEGTWYLYNVDSKLSETITNTEQQMYVVGGSTTNVRAGASTSYDVVATLYGNTAVIQLSTNGSWSYIRYDDDQYGYISTSRLAEEPENTTGTTMYVSSSQITLYAEPDTSCGETLVLGHGTEVEDRGSYYETSYHVIGYGEGTWYLYNADSKLSETIMDIEQQMYVVGGSMTNVRSGASTSYDIVATLHGNTEVTLIYTSGSWSYIRYDDDQCGYIASSRLAEEPENTTGTTMYVSSAQITLYAEPNTSCEETLVLSHGTALEDRGSYYETSYHVIGYDEKTWYLYGADNKLSATNTDTEEQMYVVGGSRTNVRAGASTSYDIVETLYGNTEVILIYTSGSWSYIRYGEEQYGFILTSSLATEPENTTGTTMQVALAQITLYAEPDLSCEKKLELSYGTMVEDRGIYYDSNYNVIYYNDENWYLYDAVNKLVENGIIDLSNSTRYISVLYTCFYAEMDFDSEYIYVPYRSEVTYLGVAAVGDNGSWIKIEYNDTVGYIYQSYDSEEKLTATYLGDLSYSSDNVYVQEILDEAIDVYLNMTTQYKHGELSEEPDENGVYYFDCIGFIIYVYRNVMQQYAPTHNLVARITSMYEEQYLFNEGLNGEAVVQDVAFEDMQPGDIIFMHLEGDEVSEDELDESSDDSLVPTHVAIYLGNNEFIHCTHYEWGTGVYITPLNEHYSEATIAVRRFVPEEIEAAEEQRYVGVSFNTNVRAAASGSAEVITSIYGNTEVTVLFTSDQWAYIRYGDEQYGFIDITHLVTEPENTEGFSKYVSAVQITLYSEPTSNCTRTLTLNYGTEVEDRGNFYDSSFNVIGYEGETWYLYNADSKLSEDRTYDEEQMYVAGASLVNVREEASASANILAKLYGNTEVTLLSTSDSWSYIRFGDDEYGYISTKYLATEPRNTTGTLKLVSASQITLYAEPTTSCAETLVLESGTEVEDREQFYSTAFNVIDYCGETWYLYNASSKLSEKVMYVSGVVTLNVRAGAATSYAVVAQLYGNTEVVQLSTSGLWSYIRFGDDKYGYTSTKYLAMEPKNTTGTLKLVSASQITLYAEPTTSCADTLVLSNGTEVEDRGQYYSTAFNVVGYEGETWYLYNASSKLSEKVMYMTGVSKANVREGAATSYAIVGQLYGNTAVVQLSTSGLWSYIRFGDDQYGYVSTGYLTVEPKNTTGTLKLVSASQITLYAEPTTSCAETLVLESGTEVEDREQYYSTAFNVIGYGGETWYLYNASSKLSEKVMYVSGVVTLNVRAGAATSYAVVAQLYGNTEVVQLSTSGLWSYIRFGDDKYGYTSTKYLAMEPKNTTGTLKLVSASQITLYAEPTTSCTEILVLNSGTEVEDRGQFYSTKYNVISYGGETWYLYNASGELSEKVMYVSGVSRANVRAGISTSYDIIAKLDRNTEVMQLSTSGAWSYIRFGDAQYGYISTSYLASVPDAII